MDEDGSVFVDMMSTSGLRFFFLSLSLETGTTLLKILELQLMSVSDESDP